MALAVDLLGVLARTIRGPMIGQTPCAFFCPALCFSPHFSPRPQRLDDDSSAGTLARKVHQLWSQKAAHVVCCPPLRLVLPDPASSEPDASERASAVDPAVQSTEQPTRNIVVPLGTHSSGLPVLCLPSPPQSFRIPPQLHFPPSQIVHIIPKATQMCSLLSTTTSRPWLTKAPAPRSPFH